MATVLSERAVEDLEGISELHLPRRLRTWNKLQVEFYKKFKLIGQHPRIGADSGRFLSGMRRVIVRDYIVYYRHVRGVTTVMRVLHGARDIDATFFDEPNPRGTP